MSFELRLMDVAHCLKTKLREQDARIGVSVYLKIGGVKGTHEFADVVTRNKWCEFF